MRTLGEDFSKLAGTALLSIGLLSACATQNNSDIIAADTVTAQEAAAEEIASPALPSLSFEWPLGDGALIAPPVEIQRAAIEACRLRGYDTSYMLNVGIDENMALGEFGCRGAD